MLVRVTRITKIYKLIRLFRLVKILKVLKSKEEVKSEFQQKLQINSGMERLMMGGILFLFICHLSACLYVIVG